MTKAGIGVIIGVGILAVGGVAYAYFRNRGESIASGSDPDDPSDADSSGDSLDPGDTGAPSAGDIEGMARMLASEAPLPNYSIDERVAICWCAINWANRTKRSIEKIMLPPHHQKGYWCSTFQSPSQTDTDLATEILNGGGQYATDPTNGAISFFEPKVQDAAVKTGAAGITKTADQIRSKWENEGLVLSATIGRWEFYKKA